MAMLTMGERVDERHKNNDSALRLFDIVDDSDDEIFKYMHEGGPVADGETTGEETVTNRATSTFDPAISMPLESRHYNPTSCEGKKKPNCSLSTKGSDDVQILSESAPPNKSVSNCMVLGNPRATPPSNGSSRNSPCVSGTKGSVMPTLQLMNGQLVVQAQLQQVQTPKGLMTVAVLPTSVMKPMVMQMQEQQSSAITATSPAPKIPPVTPAVPQTTAPTFSRPMTTGCMKADSPSSSDLFRFRTRSSGHRPIQPKPQVQRSPVPVAQAVSAQVITIPPVCSDRAANEPVTVQLDAESKAQLDEYTRKLTELKNGVTGMSPAQLGFIVKDLEGKRTEILTKALEKQHRVSTASGSGGAAVVQAVLPQVNGVQSGNVYASCLSSAIPDAGETQVVSINGQAYLMVKKRQPSEPKVIPNPPTISVIPSQPREQSFYSATGPFYVAQTQIAPLTTETTQNPQCQQLISPENRVQFQGCHLLNGTDVPDPKFLPSVPCATKPLSASERATKIRSDRKLQRQTRLKRCLEKDWKSLMEPSQNEVPFASAEDAVVRLLPYHLYSEPDLDESFLKRADNGYNTFTGELYAKKRWLEAKFQHQLLKGSMEEISKADECLMSVLFNWHENDLLKADKEKAVTDLETFVRSSEILATSEDTERVNRCLGLCSSLRNVAGQDESLNLQRTEQQLPVSRNYAEVVNDRNLEEQLNNSEVQTKALPIRLFIKRKRDEESWEASSVRTTSSSNGRLRAGCENSSISSSSAHKIPSLKIRFGENGPEIAGISDEQVQVKNDAKKAKISIAGLESSDSEQSCSSGRNSVDTNLVIEVEEEETDIGSSCKRTLREGNMEVISSFDDVEQETERPSSCRYEPDESSLMFEEENGVRSFSCKNELEETSPTFAQEDEEEEEVRRRELTNSAIKWLEQDIAIEKSRRKRDCLEVENRHVSGWLFNGAAYSCDRRLRRLSGDSETLSSSSGNETDTAVQTILG